MLCTTGPGAVCHEHMALTAGTQLDRTDLAVVDDGNAGAAQIPQVALSVMVEVRACSRQHWCHSPLGQMSWSRCELQVQKQSALR